MGCGRRRKERLGCGNAHHQNNGRREAGKKVKKVKNSSERREAGGRAKMALGGGMQDKNEEGGGMLHPCVPPPAYRDYKSKTSGLEINFTPLYGYIRKRVVFFRHPVSCGFFESWPFKGGKGPFMIASIGVLFMKNSKSNYLKRQIGPSPKDEVLFSFK